MITIAAVNVGNYRGMGARYVNALFSGCARNLTVPFRFLCFTDDATGLHPKIAPVSVPQDTIPNGHDGVYYKLAMFRPGAFTQGDRVLFIDLDTVILSNIDDIASYRGPFAMLRDPCRQHALNSSVMAWEFQQHHCEIWRKWMDAGYPPQRWGDQGWISDRIPAAVRLQDVFPTRIRSFNIECRRLPPHPPTWPWLQIRWRVLKYRLFSVPYPQGASVVYFHGEPKPDNCHIAWVQQAWRA